MQSRQEVQSQIKVSRGDQQDLSVRVVDKSFGADETRLMFQKKVEGQCDTVQYWFGP